MKAVEIGHRSLVLQWDPPSYTTSFPLTYDLFYKMTEISSQIDLAETDSVSGIEEKRLNLFRQDDNRLALNIVFIFMERQIYFQVHCQRIKTKD